MTPNETTQHRAVAFVSGAAGGGIGTAIAYQLVQDNYFVVVHGRDQKAVERLVARIECLGGECIGLASDLSDPELTSCMVTNAIKKTGPISVFVHNAADGVAHTEIDKISYGDWRREFSVIADAAFIIAAGIVPGMRKLGFGRLIFISSSAAERGSFGRAASYAAAKASLVGLAKQLALDLGPHGITANVISPSQIDTPRIRRGGRRDSKSLALRASKIPTRRVGDPRDVAALAAFLCRPESDYLTGLSIPVDGGSRLATEDTKILKKR
jgi:NAD(P)-dependent dehydrogenase (short-subunit alcohol dehydrogenase family)